MNATTTGGCLGTGSLDGLAGLERQSELCFNQRPAGHAFAGDRKRLTEADVMAMVGATPPEGA